MSVWGKRYWVGFCTLVLVASGARVGWSDTERLLVSSFASDRVGQYDPGTGDYLGDFASSDLDGVLAARVGPDGLLYVASELGNQVIRYRVDTGERVDIFIDGSAGSVPLDGPSGLDWAPNGDLYVSSFNNDSVLRFDGGTGDFLAQVVSGGGLVNGPDNGTIFGPDGKLYIPSYFNNRIVTYDPMTGDTEAFINAIVRPRVIVFHEDQLYVTSESTRSVRRYTQSGSFVDIFIQEPAGVIGQPVGLVHHEGAWLVSSASLDKVLKFSDDGDLLDPNFVAAGAGGADAPVFLTLVRVPEPRLGIIPVFVLFAGCRRSRHFRGRLV